MRRLKDWRTGVWLKNLRRRETEKRLQYKIQSPAIERQTSLSLGTIGEAKVVSDCLILTIGTMTRYMRKVKTTHALDDQKRDLLMERLWGYCSLVPDSNGLLFIEELRCGGPMMAKIQGICLTKWTWFRAGPIVPSVSGETKHQEPCVNAPPIGALAI